MKFFNWAFLVHFTKIIAKKNKKIEILKTILDWDGETMSTQQAKEVVIRIPSYKSTVISIKGISTIQKYRLIHGASNSFWFSCLKS